MANHLTFSLRLGYTYGFADILDRQNPDFRASPNVKTTVGSRNLRQYSLLKIHIQPFLEQFVMFQNNNCQDRCDFQGSKLKQAEF